MAKEGVVVLFQQNYGQIVLAHLVNFNLGIQEVLKYYKNE
jgi:hypothetical protein